MSSLSLSYRFAAARQVLFRTGVGGLHWIEDSDAAAQTPLSTEERTRRGVDFHYGVDAFITRPLILSAETRAGVVGESAFIWQLRTSLGAAIGPAEVYAGYHAITVASVPLGGLLVGVRGWW